MKLDFCGGVAQFAEGEAPWRGLVGRDGRVVLRPKYEVVSEFKEGLAYVRNEERYGFINPRGEEVIPLFFEGARQFSDGIAHRKLLRATCSRKERLGRKVRDDTVLNCEKLVNGRVAGSERLLKKGMS